MFFLIPFLKFIKQFLYLFYFQSYPFVYAFMTRKTTEAYVALFAFIAEKVCILNPVSFMTDYEAGMRNAIRTSFPACAPKGCYFHYTQALRKRGQKLSGFFPTIVKNKEQHRLYHKFLVLPLLPPGLIPGAFAILKSAARSHGTIFDNFVTYFEMHWMLMVGPEAFSVHGLRSRTNNFVESHNSSLNKMISVGSSLLTVVSGLLTDELRKVRDLKDVLNGREGVYRAPDKAYVRRAEFIAKMQGKLACGEINVQEFLCSLSCKQNPVAYNLANFEGELGEDENDDIVSRIASLRETYN